MRTERTQPDIKSYHLIILRPHFWPYFFRATVSSVSVGASYGWEESPEMDSDKRRLIHTKR